MSSPAGDESTDPDPAWEAFAAREPHFAVLSAPQFLRANLTAGAAREFFDSGEILVNWMLRTIELRLVPEFAPVSVLEYGCGLGRLAIPFARRPGAVVAVDRSPVMIHLARLEAERQGITHIEFLRPPDLLESTRLFDLITCYLVLQRMPQTDGVALIRRLVRHLGPGGVGVFHVPYETTTSRVVSATRWLRERVPGVNRVANTFKGKPPGDPFVASHAYDLHEVLRTFDNAPMACLHVRFVRHEGLAGAIIFAQAPPLCVERGSEREAPFGVAPVMPEDVPDTARPIHVADVVASASIAELNEKAEKYFTSLSSWEHHLAKPFSTADEAPSLLMDLATLLQGLHVTPGTTVLEFGAGTGWLARFLTQLGCRVLLLDVSPTALRIARELYDRMPVIGDQPAPQFLLFDGRRIELPEKSIDRIVSFHAFHHVANPHDLLLEFARVLRPGGIAGFAEPGPRHSRGPTSQFEMRTYGVVENDIDIHALWRTARAGGFTDLKLVVFHGPAYQISLDEFEDLLAGGPEAQRFVESTRGFLRHVRSFLLFKGTAGLGDSRASAGLACQIQAAIAGGHAVAGQPIVVDAVVKNAGPALWLASVEGHGRVALGAHLYDAAGTLLNFDYCWSSLTHPSRDIAPGETVRCRMQLPPLEPGRYHLEVDCVASGVTWFAQVGSPPATIDVDVSTE